LNVWVSISVQVKMRRLLWVFLCLGMLASAFGQRAGQKFNGFTVGNWSEDETQYEKWLATLHKPEKSIFRAGGREFLVVITKGGSGLVVSAASIVEAIHFRAGKGERVLYKCVSGLACSTENPVKSRLSKDKKGIELFTFGRKKDVVLLRYALR
jgi:hypothetical protein